MIFASITHGQDTESQKRKRENKKPIRTHAVDYKREGNGYSVHMQISNVRIPLEILKS